MRSFEAATAITYAFDYPSTPAVTFRDAESAWTATPGQLGLTLDLAQTVNAAYDVGRSGNLFGDALAKKSELNPDMLAAWDEAAKEKGCTRRKLVANLPYVIATPLISNLLVARVDIERMVVMVQWEIAERLRASPVTKDYNALSVFVQSVADVETVRKVLPSNFHPRPKVDSARPLWRQ